jgi:uncharacterized protein YbcI
VDHCPAPGIMNPGCSGNRKLLSCRPGPALARAPNRTRDDLDVAMKTQAGIEAGICEGMTQLVQEYIGRGPKNIQAHLLGDLIVVRLVGVLTVAEQHLVKTLPSEKGRDLLKNVRTHQMETARPLLGAMVQEITGAKVLSLQHDISTVTGKEVVIFTLAGPPRFAKPRRNRALRVASLSGLSPAG